MHIGGMGDVEKLAASVGKVYATVKATTGQHTEHSAQATIDPEKTTLDASKLDAIFQAKGEFAKGVYKVTFGRVTQMDGHEMGNAMGVNTWAAFAGADDKAAVMGDFAMTEAELQPAAQGAARGEVKHCRHPQPHDRRITANHVPALLGDRPNSRTRGGIERGAKHPVEMIELSARFRAILPGMKIVCRRHF